MSSYSDPSNHRGMVFDAYRNGFYQRALERCITPESIVLDLGAGVGGFGLTAAKLGAKRAYLVDPSPAIFVAKEVAKANGLDNVECFHGRIEDIELPSKVDVIISVFTGNFMLSEDLLPSLFYARDKWLKTGGALVPNRARMLAAPMQMPKFYENYLLAWENDENMQALGIDYSVAKKYAANREYHDNYRDSESKQLASAQVLTALDFYSATRAECFSENTYECSEEGSCHGWLGWFEANFDEEVFSTGIDAPYSHWSQVLLPLPEPVALAVGDSISFSFKRPQYGATSWTTKRQDKIYRQSTFLSRPIIPSLVPKQNVQFQPNLNEDGKVLLSALELFGAGNSVSDISAKLVELYPTSFKEPKEASDYVKSLSTRYSE